MKTCQDLSFYEIAPVISFFPCKCYVLIYEQLIRVQNWTGKLYQVKHENLSVCFRCDVFCLLVIPGVTFVPFAVALHWLMFSWELLINPSDPFPEHGCLDSPSSILYLSADDFCLCVFTEWHFSSMLFIQFVSHTDSQISFLSYACWKHPVWQVWEMKFRNCAH